MAAGVAARVKARRRSLKMSARVLAERCSAAGVPTLTREAISNLEVGRRKDVTVDEADCLARVLDVPLAELVRGVSITWDDLPRDLTWGDLPPDGFNFEDADSIHAWIRVAAHLAKRLHEAERALADGSA